MKKYLTYTKRTALGLLAVIVLGLLYGYVWGTTQFQIKEVSFASRSLPAAFDGFRIVQLSDLHLGSWQDEPEVVERIVELVNAQRADLIVFTGDLVSRRSHEIDGLQPILKRLRARHGVYSVLGNHDYSDYSHWPSEEAKAEDQRYLIEQQEAMGWKLLNNDHAFLHEGLDSIALVGVENDGEPPFPQHAKLQEALEGTGTLYKVLLSHNPTHWRREVLPTSDVDLMLAGHTHAMQFMLFGHSLSELRYPEWRGLYQEENRGLYVNIGTGYLGIPIRLFAWPEITVITLTKKRS